MLAPLRFGLFALLTVSLLFPQSPPQQPASPQGPPNATVSASPDEADSLVLPDGTPIRVRLVDGFSSESAEVGDVIGFTVAFEVRANGVVVIPRHTGLAGKVASVSHPRRGARNGQVGVVYEPLTMPTGETATVRPTRKPPHPRKAAKAAEAAAATTTMAAGVFITAGIPLIVLPFTKGDEQVVPEGSTEVVYLNGPVRVSRKAAMVLQPDPASGHAYVYIGGIAGVGRNGLTVPKLFCGERILAGSFPSKTELELKPGAYWFSTNIPKDRPVRLEVLPGHEYIVGRNKHGVLAKEFQASSIPTLTYYNSAAHLLRLIQTDLTKLPPEEYRALTAEPAVKVNDSRTQRD